MADPTVRPSDPPQVRRGSKIVSILVGPDKEEFTVHKDLISASSIYFKQAFDGQFVEARTEQIILLEEDGDIFEYFCDWLYSGQRMREIIRNREKWALDLFWIKVFCMADMLFIPGLQIFAWQKIRSHFNHHFERIPSPDFIQFLFDKISDSTQAIKMYVLEHVAFWTRWGNESHRRIELIQAHHQFCSEMVAILARALTSAVMLHPSRTPGFEKKHGLDLSQLEEEARASDQKEGVTGGAKSSGMLP